MKIIRRLRVRNLVTYESADLDLTAAPVTVIRGRNFDRKNKKSANAVGKSLLLSTIPTLMFAKPPTSDKNKSARDLYSHKNGRIEVDIASYGHEYTFSQFMKGASTLAYAVTEDGQALNYNKSVDALAKIRHVFPLTEDQFYAFVYLDSRNYHALQRGTSQARFEFFENIFNLGVYETIAKEIGKRYTAVRDQIRDLKTYRTEFSVRRSELKVDRATYDAMEQKIQSLQTRLGEAQTRLSGWYEHLRRRDSFLFLTEGMSDDVLRWPLDMMKSQVTRRKAQHAEMRAMYAQAVAQISGQKMRADLIERYKSLENEFTTIPDEGQPDVSAETARQVLTTVEQKLGDLLNWNESHWKALDRFAVDEKTWANIFASGETTLIARRGALSQEIKATEVVVENLRAVIRHATTHADAKCPHCQQALDPNTAKRFLATEQGRLDDLLAKHRNFSLYLDIYREVNALPFPTYNEFHAERVNLERQRDASYQILRNWNKFEATQRRRDQIKAEAKRIGDQIKALPSSDEEYTAPETYQKFADDIAEQITALQAAIQKKEKLAEYDPKWTRDRVSAERETLNKKIAEFQPTVQRIQAALQQTTVEFAHARATYTDLVRLNKKIKDLEARTADASVLEHMREAFGPKGLRRNRIAVLAELFTMNLNRFAPLVYGEKMVFQTTVGENAFDITATRNQGKTSDVRQLSASEDKQFRLLALLAILPFIPDRHRTNLVVLDEMEAGLDPVSKQLFVTEFLPMLNTIIPNIVIITPQPESEFYIPNVQTVVVEKRGGVSTLRKGDFSWSPSSSVSRTPIHSNSTTTRQRK